MSRDRPYRYLCHIQNVSANVTVRQCRQCRKERGGCDKYRLAIKTLIREWEI